MTVTVVSATPGKTTGGGSIDKRVRSFGFVAQGKEKHGDLTFKGNIEYRDKDADLNLHSNSITFVRLEGDGVHARFKGTATVNGDPGYTFHVSVEDNGELGKGADVFRIEISGLGGFYYDSDAVTSGGGVLDGGNIQVHKAKGSNLVVHDTEDETSAAADDVYLHSVWQLLAGVHTVAVVDDANARSAAPAARASATRSPRSTPISASRPRLTVWPVARPTACWAWQRTTASSRS